LISDVDANYLTKLFKETFDETDVKRLNNIAVYLKQTQPEDWRAPWSSDFADENLVEDYLTKERNLKAQLKTFRG
jgi:hypothetical protein